MIPNSMKAAVTTKAGGPEVIEIKHVEVPRAKSGWTLVKVMAAGVNRSEMYTRQGHSPDVMFPRIQGIECVGLVVDSLNEELPEGTKVVANMGEMGRDFDGSYAEYALLPDKIISRVETSLDWKTLGALPEMYATAYGSVFECLRVQEGDQILIRGGSSSVGLAAIGLAKSKGAQVTASIRKKSFDTKKDVLVAAGATPIVDDGDLASKGQSYNKVLELVGTSSLRDSLKLLVPGGICCFTGILGNQWVLDHFAPFSDLNSSTYLTTYASKSWTESALTDVIRLVEDGKLSPPIYKTFRLDQLKEIHDIMESGVAVGKMVVMP